MGLAFASLRNFDFNHGMHIFRTLMQCKYKFYAIARHFCEMHTHILCVLVCLIGWNHKRIIYKERNNRTRFMNDQCIV